MKAIVCTYDAQEGYAQLTYKSYMKHWPDCPFTFRIPVNSQENLTFFRDKPNVELVESPRDVPETMKRLLHDLHDDEFVFWCIDDRWLKQAYRPDALRRVATAVERGDFDYYDAVKLQRWREATLDETQNVAGVDFVPHDLRKNAFGFWHHQFIRASVLKRVFFSDVLPEDYRFRHVCKALKNRVHVFRRPVLVPKQSLVLLGEPCHRGMTTPDGFAAMRDYDCPIPPLEFTEIWKDFRDNTQDAICGRNTVVSSLGRSGSKLLMHALKAAGINLDHSFHPANHQYPEFIERLPRNVTRERVRRKKQTRASERQQWRVIFTFADPIDIVLSVENRILDRGRKWGERHFANMRANLKDFPRIYEKDALQLERLFDAYYRPQTFPLLTLRFETMWDHQDTISRFVGRPIQLPPKALDNVHAGSIPRDRRRSLLDPAELKKLQRTYERLTQKIRCAEDAHVWNVSPTSEALPAPAA